MHPQTALVPQRNTHALRSKTLLHEPDHALRSVVPGADHAPQQPGVSEGGSVARLRYMSLTMLYEAWCLVLAMLRRNWEGGRLRTLTRSVAKLYGISMAMLYEAQCLVL